MGATDDATADVDRFVAAYRTTLPEVFGYLARATAGDRALAEDLTSETYTAALSAWRRGQADALTVPWLIGVARHKLVDRFRRADREQRKLAMVHALGADDIDDSGDAVDRELLFGAIRRLPPLQRAAVALRYVDDLPVREVAHLLDRSVAATDSLLRRARTALRALIEEAELQ
ncbi:MAG TPA: sigma-70 family RNA polymerase sigma factor [Acidimicrobiia bacterium]